MTTPAFDIMAQIIIDIERLRKKRKLTIAAFCKLTGLTDITYRDLRQQKRYPRFETLHRICEAIGAELVIGIVDEGLWKTRDNRTLIQKQADSLYEWPKEEKGK